MTTSIDQINNNSEDKLFYEGTVTNTIKSDNVLTHSIQMPIEGKVISITNPLDMPNNLEEEEYCISRAIAITMISWRLENKCDLSGNSYNDIETKKFKVERYRSGHYFFVNPIYYTMIYHPDYSFRIPYFQTIFEREKKIITYHNLQNKTIKIMRSSGDIQEIKIEEDRPLRISSKGELTINVQISDDGFWKTVCFNDIYNSSSDSYILGIIALNPQIFTPKFILKLGIKKYEESHWINKIQNKNIELFKEILDKETRLNYEFYHLDTDL